MQTIDPEKIWSSSHLPSLPAVAVRLLAMSRNLDTDLKSVVEVIKSDPAISAKILKASNTSFFGFRSEIKSIDRAVPLLGTNAVISLALSFSLTDQAMSRGPLAPHYRDYWLQSVVQAAAAELLGRLRERGRECEYFMCGLLMDIGRLAMLKAIPQEYLPVLEAAGRQQLELVELERELLGLDHVEIGVRLMQNWKMSDVLVQAIANHHQTPDRIGASHLGRSSMVAALAGQYYCAQNKGQALKGLRAATAEFFGFDEDALHAFLEQISHRIEETSDLFAVSPDELGDPAELMAQANDQLVQLTLQAQAENAVAARRQQQLETDNRKLQQQAHHDPLTGLRNRHSFELALRQEVQRCCRDAAPMAVVLADVDHFKQVNDTYGHLCGDAVLRETAARLSNAFRAADVVARYGGEEFIALIHQPTEKGLSAICERLRSRIAAEEFAFEDQRLRVTVSLGAALSIPERNDSEVAARLTAAADAALYESKRGGRNQARVCVLLDEQERRLCREITRSRFSRWLVRNQIVEIATVSQVLADYRPQTRRTGEVARELGLLDADAVDRILEDQQRTGDRFGTSAIRLGLLNEGGLATLLAMQQEDPQQLAQALIERGSLDPRTAGEALDRYLAGIEVLGGVASRDHFEQIVG